MIAYVILSLAAGFLLGALACWRVVGWKVRLAEKKLKQVEGGAMDLREDRDMERAYRLDIEDAAQPIKELVEWHQEDTRNHTPCIWANSKGWNVTLTDDTHETPRVWSTADTITDAAKQALEAIRKAAN